MGTQRTQQIPGQLGSSGMWGGAALLLGTWPWFAHGMVTRRRTCDSQHRQSDQASGENNASRISVWEDEKIWG